MKLKLFLLGTLLAASVCSFAQTLYVPSGTSGISTSSNYNVGIGTPTPKARLDVTGSIYIPTGQSYWIGATSDAGNRMRLHHNGSNAFIDYSPNLYFRVGNIPMLAMTTDGNINIYNNLQVTKKINVGSPNSYSLANFTINSDGNPNNTEWQNHPLMIWSGLTGSDYVLMAGVSKAFKCSYIQSVNLSVTPSTLALNYRGGLVSIGAVDFTKTTGYSLAVAGGILAEKVVVKLRANWPDYVFDDNYKLAKLDEVESFIKENKHLPETPTASEISNEGIDVAVMNSILLKKIEELTLYTIELNKRINSLEIENQKIVKQ